MKYSDIVVDNKIISVDILDVLKDIQRSIFNGKLKTIKLSGNDILVTCPVHKDGHENKPSCGIYVGESNSKVNYGDFNCFACGAKGPFYHFVAECFDKSDAWAKQWLIDNYVGDEIDRPITLPDITTAKLPKQLLDESILDTFESYHPYMQQRHLNKHILEVFEVKYDPKTTSLVFPVRNENGELVMLTRRNVTNKTFMIDEDKEKPLYLLYYIIEHNIQKCMIAEGQIDALTACGFGMPCMATIGSLSDHQIDLINKSGIRVLYTFFDADEWGQKFTKKLNAGIRDDILVINVKMLYPNKKDINDLTEEQFWKCVQTAEEEF